MITNALRMRCGGCGGDSFEIYTKQEDTAGLDAVTNIMVECKGCKSVSIIRPFKPLMTIDWGEKSEGILCIFPSDKEG